MNRRTVQQDLKVCGFYDNKTHRCLADGTSVCTDPHIVKGQDCETAKEYKDTGSAMSTKAAKPGARPINPNEG